MESGPSAPLSMEALFSVAGRTVIVTGGSRGLGARFVRLFARYGANVLFCARNGDHAEALARELAGEPGRVEAVELDIAAGGAADALLDRTERLFGTATILVSNAAMLCKSPVQNLSDEDWQRSLTVNLTAAFALARAGMTRMIAAGTGGSIVTIGSTGALLAPSSAAAYVASKAGLLGLTRAIAIDGAAHGIRCNCLMPGNTITDLTPAHMFAGEGGHRLLSAIPLGRAARPADYDGLMLLLASDAGAYITGATMIADGGKSAMQAGRSS